jgi:hypothetical protein
MSKRLASISEDEVIEPGMAMFDPRDAHLKSLLRVGRGE